MIVYSFLLLTSVVLCQGFVNNFITGTTNKTVDFVEVIKQDLRRNNDDYKEILHEKETASTSQRSGTVTKKKTENIPLMTTNKRGFRRNERPSYQDYDYEETIKPITESKTINNITTISSINLREKTSRINLYKLKQNQTPIFNDRNKVILPIVKSSSSTINIKNIPKFVKKNKINKFKQFMKNNQGLFKTYMSNRLQTQTQQPKLHVSSTIGRRPKLLKPGFLREDRKEIQRTQDKNDGELPNPVLLDMAPAKGGRIHKQRIKGRLCHRHVLMPEGPKYDSRGRWYLPAHELIARRPYNVTKKPRLLLPRCCNCCKKSVLGCE